jgi:tetratricopeptide (TPR) repeat protein
MSLMSFGTFYPPRNAQLRFWRAAALITAVTLLLTMGAFAQTDREHQAYMQAVTMLTKQAESAPLEHFVQTAASESLKRDGLEWLVASLRARETARAKAFAEQLLSRDADNALALAVTSDAVTQTAMAGQNSDQAISRAKRALRGMPQLRAPEGMREAEFAALKNELTQKLNGAVGYAYYQRNDYISARSYLRKAVALAPENAQYAYALAICDLFGNDGDEAEGYRLLARTINLTQGTPAGQELANYARRKYEERGGSSSDWDRYLAVTKLPGSTAGTTVAKAQPQPSAPARVAVAAPSQPRRGTSAVAPSKVASITRPDISAPAAPADLPSTRSVRRESAPPGAAFSLGILIQTSQASHQGRRAVINTLVDMVRHLREGDEAFLVSFAQNVAFEEDLTGNAKVLEKAMDQIRPASGTALFDAVAFAAGHLNRIARNRKRVLLVVSDGQNETSQISPLELSSELRIGDVEIYCIGINSNTVEDQYRLESLAARTGGQALFAADASQFRTAASRVAMDLGIGLR